MFPFKHLKRKLDKYLVLKSQSKLIITFSWQHGNILKEQT